MKEQILKEFDEKYVSNKIGKIYSWKAEAYTDCLGVRDFIKYAIAQTREETIREVEESLIKWFDEEWVDYYSKDVNRDIKEILNKLKK